MKLSKFLVIVIFATIVSLIYIQLQVQIFDLAYRGKEKERRIHQLLDDKGDAMHSIYTLKSANHLGVKLLAGEPSMQFLDKDHIVLLKTSGGFSHNEHSPTLKPELAKRSNFLVNIFSLKAQAEARPIR